MMLDEMQFRQALSGSMRSLRLKIRLPKKKKPTK
jgi:hypothetical protein